MQVSYNKWQTIVILFAILLSACNVGDERSSRNSGIDKRTTDIKKWSLIHAPSCSLFFDINMSANIQKDIFKCFEYINFPNEDDDKNRPKGVIAFYTHKAFNSPFSLSQKTLMLVLENYALGFAEQNELIETFIYNGAKTHRLPLRYVLQGNDRNCKTTMMVLRNNKSLYQADDFLTKKKIDKENLVDDLFSLSDSGNGMTLCSDAINLLLDYNPKLLNFRMSYDGEIPLHGYLNDVNHRDWDLNVAKKLMTKKNVNLRSSFGNTPFHNLLLHNQVVSQPGIDLIKHGLELGLNLSIENHEGESLENIRGKSLLSLILGRPDLAKALEITR